MHAYKLSTRLSLGCMLGEHPLHEVGAPRTTNEIRNLDFAGQISSNLFTRYFKQIGKAACRIARKHHVDKGSKSPLPFFRSDFVGDYSGLDLLRWLKSKIISSEDTSHDIAHLCTIIEPFTFQSMLGEIGVNMPFKAEGARNRTE